MTAPLLTRPNGKPYRPRKDPSVQEFTDSQEYTGLVVLRTHDVELARRLAEPLIAEYELWNTEPTREWWRSVPWDTSGYCDRSYVDDPVRGIPCVVFQPPW